jgi:2,3-bisphosphoglycerate-independent phosphoglycerate mutase
VATSRRARIRFAMNKKTEPAAPVGGKSRRKGPWVVRGEGVRQRFLRGMVTHDLVQRGLPFDDAYAIARSIRGQIDEREEVTTDEIRDLIHESLEGCYGRDLPRGLTEPLKPPPVLQVIYHGQQQPFSRGLLARSIHAAGLSLDSAYRLVTRLEKDLKAEGINVIPSHEVARRVGDLLERHEGIESARRYRLVRRIHRLPRPLIIYVGGASGTGKSTLALELAPLLRIYRINATDTIRQVMRMVFSPAILPALHSSTFEVFPPPLPGNADPPPAYPLDPDFSRRLSTTFQEQATRVCVGVRAVVERAIIENMSIVVEGVHLYPPLVPFGDLEGAAYQVPLMLGILNEDVHRGRFLLRSRSGGRLAERYVESFASIRSIQDFLWQQAELHDVPLLDNSDGEPPVVRTLRLVTGVLQQKLPSLARTDPGAGGVIIPTLMLTIDSLSDRPVAALNGKTPLEAADTPTLDRLAREGQVGLSDPVSPGVVSDMVSGNLALFGHSPISMKRGPIEAMGAGIELAAGDVALRANFATLNEEGLVADRRAGRIRREVHALAEALDRLSLPGDLEREVEVRVKPASEYRLAIVLRGEGLSSEIVGSDPGESPTPVAPLEPKARNPNDPRAVYTASVVAALEREAHRILSEHPINKARESEGLPPANIVLTRGAGRAHRLLPLEHAGIPLRITCISGDRTMLALAAWLGAETVTKETMTGNLDTSIEAKLRAAGEALSRSDLVVVHFSAADAAARDRRPDLKVEFLEKLDRHLGTFIEGREGALRIVIASDHATSSETGEDVADPLPVLIWGHGIAPDSVQEFNENAVKSGELSRFPLQLLIGKLFELT